MPQIDAIIPTHNAPSERLRAAVGSALDCPGLGRILIVDDGSTPPVDHSIFDAPGGGRKGRVEVVRQPNAGPSAARNRGLDATSGGADYALFLDDDDLLLPSGVAALIALAERIGAVAGVGAREEFTAGRPPVRKPPPAGWADRPLARPGDVFRPITLFGCSGLLIHRRAIWAGSGERDGGRPRIRFDESLRIGEDRDFYRRLADLGPIAISSIPAVRAEVRRDVNLTSPTHYARRVRDHLVLLERYCDTQSEAHFREATTWLLNALAKSGTDALTWTSLTAAARAHGWPVPLKARLRRAMSRAWGADN